MFSRSLALIGMSALLASCKVVQVFEKNNEAPTKVEKQKGIPFYVKVASYVQTTVYTEAWARATLTIESKVVDDKGNEKPFEPPQSYVRNVLRPIPAELDVIRTAIRDTEKRTDLETADKMLKAFLGIKEITKEQKDGAREQTKNVVDVAWVVDPDKTYYLNAPFPWFGTGNLTQKLNPDGTLSEVTSNPESKIGEGLSALVPLKEFLSGKYIEPAATVAAADDAKKIQMNSALREMPGGSLPKAKVQYTLSLTIEDVGYEYTLTKQLKPAKPVIQDKERRNSGQTQPEPPPLSETVPKPEPIKFAEKDDGTAQFSRKEIGNKDDDEKKDESPKIGISGTINLPKGFGGAGGGDKPEGK